MTRRRQQRDTIPEAFVPMHEIARQWFARLNDSTAAAPTEREDGLRGSAVNLSTQEG